MQYGGGQVEMSTSASRQLSKRSDLGISIKGIFYKEHFVDSSILCSQLHTRDRILNNKVL